ncbi:MAG: hypothetical protein ACFFFH_10140 [Candidatus Thorarchaeota archaeon]
MVFPKEKIIGVNWDFPRATTQTLTHKYHSYPARFIPQIPRTIYRIFLGSGGSRIFDPFVGCGTSLVEGVLCQHHSGGVDQNPLAILLSRVKTQLLDIELLSNHWSNFQSQFTPSILKKEQYSPREFIFPKRNLTKRFTKENIQVISLILDYIEQKITSIEYQNFFKVGLSSTISTLIESKSWRNINIWFGFSTKINAMIKIMREFNSKIAEFNNGMQKDIKVGDARNLSFISEASIDCIVTSPPYVNALDYNRIHQYNMSILGFDYRSFAKVEIGAHGHHISNRWRLLTEYLFDMFYSMSEMGRITTIGGIICLVIGDSCLEYERIKSHIHFRELGELLGLTHQLSLSRNIDVASKSTSRDIGNIYSEHLIFFTKDKDFESHTDAIIYEYIEHTMSSYLIHVKKSEGTCLRNKPVLSKERQELAVERVEEAISRIKKDCRSL